MNRNVANARRGQRPMSNDLVKESDEFHVVTEWIIQLRPRKDCNN